jgi:nucleotide-binding universal stress UspA family protein
MRRAAAVAQGVDGVKKLLIATDLSARSDRALRRAVSLAQRLGASLEILHVVDDTVPSSIVDQYEEAAKSTIGQLLAVIPEAAGVKPQLEFVRGQAYEAIMQRATRIDAELIVLGITRHTAFELFRGTTAERIIRLGDLPVLMVKDPPGDDYARVLVATDNSPAATRAVGCALAIAPGAEFRLLHVIHVPFKGLLGSEAVRQMRAEQEQHFMDTLRKEIHGLATKLAMDPPKTTTLVQEGEIHDAIRGQVAQFKPTLLALGTHGRAGLRHALIGSVAEDMLSDPPADILVAKAW